MILISQAEMTMLRKGQVREVTIKKPRPRATAAKAKCRWLVGQDYNVTARETHDDTGTLDKKQTTIRCLILSIAGDERTSTHWTLALTMKARSEHPVYLARNPAAQETDLVTDPSKAASGDVEVFGESAERVLAALKEKADDKPRKVKREQALANLQASIAELEKNATISERGQLQRLRASARKLEDAA